MKYYIAKFHIKCTGCTGDDICLQKQAATDLLMALAAEAGFESFEETEEGVDGYVQTNMFDQQMLDGMIKDFPIEGIDVSYEIGDVENKNWNKAWEDAGFEPIIIDDKCVIHDLKHDIPDGLGNVMDIKIEARQAFGTGTHETTRMIIRHLLGTDLTGKAVLDCGCGTGILSIAASMQGAGTIVGYDIDEWSVENTRHNAALNNIGNIEVFHGDTNILSHISGLFNVVLANINRNILLADMEKMKDVMSSQSTLIISGFYKEDISMLVAKAADLGLSLTEMDEDNNWCMLVFVTANT